VVVFVMKKDSVILFVGLGVLGFALWKMFGNRPTSAPGASTAAQGTSSALSALLTRLGAAPGKGATATSSTGGLSSGSGQSGQGSPIDLGGLVKAAVNAVSDLFKSSPPTPARSTTDAAPFPAAGGLPDQGYYPQGHGLPDAAPYPAAAYDGIGYGNAIPEGEYVYSQNISAPAGEFGDPGLEGNAGSFTTDQLLP
jgi:hypothetical protein